MSSSPTRRSLLIGGGVAASAALAGAAFTPLPAAATRNYGQKPTIVLVHGAFADASCWNEVVRRLQREGHTVLAPANPLRGVAPDAAYLASILRTLTGPIVLVGHSYGGVSITNAATGNPDVKALVYVAAFAPDAGETVETLQLKYPGTKLDQSALDVRPYPVAAGVDSYEGYVKASAFREVFAGDLPAVTTTSMAATQRPADVRTLGEPSGSPAWKSIPSWYLVAGEDNLIPAAAQRFMAGRAGARTFEVRASHVVMISQPGFTAGVIGLAAHSVERGQGQ